MHYRRYWYYLWQHWLQWGSARQPPLVRRARTSRRPSPPLHTRAAAARRALPSRALAATLAGTAPPPPSRSRSPFPPPPPPPPHPPLKRGRSTPCAAGSPWCTGPWGGTWPGQPHTTRRCRGGGCTAAPRRTPGGPGRTPGRAGIRRCPRWPGSLPYRRWARTSAGRDRTPTMCSRHTRTCGRPRTAAARRHRRCRAGTWGWGGR